MRSKGYTRLYEEAIVHLAELIRRGRLKPGDRLPSERELAARLRMSRATLREGLRVMQRQGILLSRHGAGNYVAQGSPAELAQALDHLALSDIFELRYLIEPSIGALAAQRATPLDLARFESILVKQERLVARNKNIAEVDAHFHAALAEATHNRALVQISAALMHVIAPSRIPRLQTSQRARSSLASHRAIYEAVRARNPAKARRETEEHIRSVDRALFGLPASGFLIGLPAQQEVNV